MQGSRTPALLKLLALGGVLASVAWAPSKAADDDYNGWFVALDLATTQPNGFDQSYAAVVDNTNNFTSRLVVDNDTDLTYKVKVGFGLGQGLGRLMVSYWSFDNEQTSNEIIDGNLIYPTVFSYGFNNFGTYGMSGPVTATIASKIKATTIDLDYVRPIAASEKNSLSWLMGLRSATFEEDQGFDGTDSSYTVTYIQTRQIKSDAIGVRVGATAHFGFTPHFAIEGSLIYSFLQASTDAVANETGTAVDRNSASDDHIRGETRDIDLRAVWTYGNLGYWAGYAASTWDGFVADPISGGSCCAVATGMGRSTRESVGFNSLHGGIVFKFGKGGI